MTDKLTTARNKQDKALERFQSLDKKSQEYLIKAHAKIKEFEIELAFVKKTCDATIDEAEDLISSLAKSRKTDKQLAALCLEYEKRRELEEAKELELATLLDKYPQMDSLVEILNENLMINPELATPTTGLSVLLNLNLPIKGLLSLTSAIRQGTSSGGQKRPRSEEEKRGPSPTHSNPLGFQSNCERENWRGKGRSQYKGNKWQRYKSCVNSYQGHPH